MRIPENRIYKVRSTARQAAKIADPNLGAGARAIAAMAPAYQGAIAANNQRIRNVLDEAKNPHWLTHVKLANDIAQTVGRTARDIGAIQEQKLKAGLQDDLLDYAKAKNEFYANAEADDLDTLDAFNAAYSQSEHYKGLSSARRERFDAVRQRERERYADRAISDALARRERSHQDTIKAQYTKHMRQLYDHMDENGNVVDGLLRTKWVEGESGPGKACMELESSFDDSGISQKDRVEWFDAWRESEKLKYANDAVNAEEKQRQQYSAEMEKIRVAQQAAFLEEHSWPEDDKNGAWTKGLAEMSQDLAVRSFSASALQTPEGKAAAARLERDTIANYTRKRHGQWTAKYEQLGEMGGDEEEAQALRAAILADTAAASANGILTDAEVASMAAADEAMEGIRRANIEKSYRAAESEADLALKDWILCKSVDEKGMTDADGRMEQALSRLPEGRRAAALTEIQAKKDEVAAAKMFQDHARDWDSDEARQAFANLTEPQQKMAAKMYLQSLGDVDEMRAKAAKSVSSMVSQLGPGESGATIHDRLEKQYYAGLINEAQFHSGVAALREEMDYLKLFKGNDAEAKLHSDMIEQGIGAVFSGLGADGVTALFQHDKDGKLVWGADGPMLAKGVDPQRKGQWYEAGRRTVYGSGFGANVTREVTDYTDVSAQTVAKMASLMRTYIAAYYMGNPLDGYKGNGGRVDFDKMVSYCSRVLSADVAHASDEAMSAQVNEFLGAIGMGISEDKNLRKSSKDILLSANRHRKAESEQTKKGE